MLELVTAPTDPLVSTADARSWVRQDDTTDDTLLAAIVLAATQRAEDYTGRKFLSQTWRRYLDALVGLYPGGGAWWDGERQGCIGEIFGGGAQIDLLLAPVSSITTMSYFGYDASDWAVFASTNYYLAGSQNSPGKLVLKDGCSWPSPLRSSHAVKIDFVVGYGATAASVPAAIVTAVKALGAYLYEHRGDDEQGAMPGIVKQLLDPYVLRRI